MRLRHLFFILFLFPIYAFAHITGTYHVSGFDPSTNQDYSGSVIITKEDSIYTAHWTFSSQNTDTGTGVIKGDAIAFVFNEGDSPSYGVQLYEIDDHILRGPWVRFGGTEKGFEKLKKMRE